ncbi:MAG: MFS transporter [Eubacteriales bacterium]|nr:MFS transporter [Eubacteriales bacterium]
MENSQKVRPFGMRDKIGYAFGDMGCNFSFQLVTTFMQLFYLQYIGISTSHYAVIILISKLWDAINDVLIGNLVDTKRIGKKSKYMPWIMLGGILLVFTTVMIFIPVTGFPYWGKFAWCLGSYCLWSVAYTMVNVPFGSLHSVISDVPSHRQSLSTFRSIGAALPAIICMMVLPSIVYDKKTTAAGETVEVLKGETLLPVAIVLSLIAVVVFYATTKMVTERVKRNDDTANVTGAKAFFSAFKTFFTNRAMVGCTLATVASVALFNSTMSLNNMVFQYFFKDTSKIMLAMIGSYLPMVVVMIFIGKLTAKFGKKNVLVVAALASSIAGAVAMFAPIQPNGVGMILYIVFLCFLNTGNCVFQITVWAIVADCIEVSYRKTGKSEEGSLYALYSFFRKLSQGVGQAVVSIGLGAIGFVEGAEAVQPEGFGVKVKTLYMVILFIGSFLTFIFMKFVYNIGKKEELEFAAHSQELEEIQEMVLDDEQAIEIQNVNVNETGDNN